MDTTDIRLTITIVASLLASYVTTALLIPLLTSILWAWLAYLITLLAASAVSTTTMAFVWPHTVDLAARAKNLFSR